MGLARLEWRGREVANRVGDASREAIDETTQAAADDAKASHWWRSRRGQLESEIINEPARSAGGRISGKFGSTRRRGFYGLILEYRQPFLRPAADRQFPRLARRIRGRLGWQ